MRSGAFRPVSWDEALALVTSKLQAACKSHGGESILPIYYGGSNGLLSQGGMDHLLFRRLGASRLLTTVCAAPTGAAAQGLYGKMPGVALEDYAESKLIILWGVNPKVSGIHLMPVLKRARDRGARVVVIDPRTTHVARQADLHLAPYPGTDLPLALCLIRWLFEQGIADLFFLSRHTTGAKALLAAAEPWTMERTSEITGVSADKIGRLARWYCATRPAVVRCGWGVERNRNGGSAVSAILALPAVGGKFGVRGGGFTMSNGGGWSLSLDEEAEPTRAVNMNRIGRTLLEEADPSVQVAFVYNCNPLATLPEQERVRAGLSREDLFTVVFDPVFTDTARYADVLLPSTTFLERTEVRKSYGVYALQRAEAVIAPVGLSRSNHAVFTELLQRLGLDREGDPTSETDLLKAMLASHPKGDQVLESLRTTGGAIPEIGERPVQFVDVFPRTADGRIHLFPPELDAEAPHGLYGYQPDPATDDYPLALLSPATNRTTSSTLGELWKSQVSVQLHPADAAERGIGPGDVVEVFNDLGCVRCSAQITEDVVPRVAVLPKGLWSHHTLNGVTANALAPDCMTDLGGGACFNDARVQVRLAAAEAS